MFEDLIYFYGKHHILFILIIFLLYLVIQTIAVIYFFKKQSVNRFLFICVVSFLLLNFEFLDIRYITPKFQEIDVKRNPCEYPDYVVHYEYVDFFGNSGSFTSDDSSACSYNYEFDDVTCRFDNTVVRVVSYTKTFEDIYPKECKTS